MVWYDVFLRNMKLGGTYLFVCLFGWFLGLFARLIDRLVGSLVGETRQDEMR